MENWSREQLLLYVPILKIKESLKNNKSNWKEAYDEQIQKITPKTRIFNYQIQTTLLEDCSDEWINSLEYISELTSSKDFSIWNDSSIEDIESISISMNIEKQNLATNIFVRPRSNHTYKNTL